MTTKAYQEYKAKINKKLIELSEKRNAIEKEITDGKKDPLQGKKEIDDLCMQMCSLDRVY